MFDICVLNATEIGICVVMAVVSLAVVVWGVVCLIEYLISHSFVEILRSIAALLLTLLICLGMAGVVSGILYGLGWLVKLIFC